MRAARAGAASHVCPLSVESAERVVLEGVVVSVRKASRTLAFLSVQADTLSMVTAGDADGPQSQVVQAVLEHEAGWRRVCGEDGPRVCCGAVLSLWGDREQEMGPGSPLSVLVRGGLVRSSPHDSLSATGVGIQPHALVERASSGKGGQPQRSGLPLTLCKQWWKARIDGTACECANPSAVADRGERREEAAVGACGFRHYFASADEVAKYGLLEEKRERSRAQERAGSADDPLSPHSKLGKSQSDRLFVAWLLVSLPLPLSFLFSLSLPLSLSPSLPLSL